MTEVDARTVAPGSRLDTDVCIVGAGPAGLVLAAELVSVGTDVVLLESGSPDADPGVQILNQGNVTGDAYAGLTATRHRGVGGTAGIWNTPVSGGVGAKYVPLDPVDFSGRAASALDGWPMSRSDLEPFYARAARRCLGPGAATAWFGEECPELHVPVRPPPPLRPATYRLARRDVLLDPCLSALAEAGRGRLYTNATVTKLATDKIGRRIRGVEVADPTGARWSVTASRYVLAAGAIENARLLLASGSAGIGNESDQVGRGFMEHPRDSTIRVRPRSTDFFREAAFYDLAALPVGGARLGRLAIDQDVVLSSDLLNSSGTLLPVTRRSVVRIRRLAGRWGRGPVVRRLLYRDGHGWSQRRLPGLTYDGFQLLINVEQSPHPENRILLGERLDAHGVPRAELHWRWRSEDDARLARVREVFAAALDGSDFGEVVVDPPVPPDPNAHHHAGTTRMHRDPERGVCDPDGRVHSQENLFVTGSSVFPTAGYANPVLTIVALAIRLADHLAGR